MIVFDSSNPFPLLPLNSYTYAMAKEHAIQADRWLGFEIPEIERKLETLAASPSTFPQEKWIGLDAQSFLTPYVEIRSILDLLQPSPAELVIDLGCGYGRMGHVLGRHYPEVSFLGYELVRERVKEAQKRLAPLGYQKVRIEEMDLARFRPLEAEYYFIYDYGSKAAIEKTLMDLKEISKSRSIQVVARGRASRFYIHKDHSWLSEVQSPRHFETFSIFQS